MGAFDGELYALGYRFSDAREPKPNKPELVGPTWGGKCVGHCSAEICYPCPSNNRLTPEQLESTYQTHQKWYEHAITRFPSLGEVEQRKTVGFIEMYPGFLAWLEADARRIEGGGE